MAGKLMRLLAAIASITVLTMVPSAQAAQPPFQVRQVSVVVDSAGVATVVFRLVCNVDPTDYGLGSLGTLDVGQEARGGYFALFPATCDQPITAQVSTEAQSLPFIPGSGGHISVALCQKQPPDGSWCRNVVVYEKDHVHFKAA